MTSGAPTGQSAALSSSDVLRLAAGLALCFGVLEAIETVLFGPMPAVQSMGKTSLDVLWAAPVMHAILNVVIAAGLMGLVRVGLPLPRSVAAGLFALTGALGVTLYSGTLGRFAAILLALGLGAQIGRLTNRPAFWTWLQRLTVVLAVGVLGAPVALRSLDAWRSAQSLRRAAPSRGQPNVIVIVLDTVRGDYLSSNGFPRPTTPAIDRFAAQGTRFAQAYSASSWTLPSHAALLTGMPISQQGSSTAWRRVPSDAPQIQEVFQTKGYATGAFAANKVFLLPEWGFGRGFDTFDVYDTRTLFARTTFGRSVRTGLRLFDQSLDPFRPATAINSRFERWTETLGDRPFFALINYMDAHEPYGPPGHRPPLAVWDRGAARTPAENQVLADAYERCIRDLDAQLAGFFDRLARQSWWENTLVVIVADHGEAIVDNTFDHGLDLTWEQIQVPLILRMSGRIPSGRRIAVPVSTNDVAATIQELAGVEAPRLPGRSLSRFFESSTTPGDQEAPDGVLTELIHPRSSELTRSIVLGDFQYIFNVQTGAERLYRFRDDPAGTRNLASDPARSQDLVRLRDALRRHPAPRR